MKLKSNNIYNLDCFDFLQNIDDNIIDLAIIDPPYNMKKARWDTFKNTDDFFDFTYKWIDAVLPKLKDTASIYIFNNSLNNVYILQYLINKKLIFKNWITWYKKDGFSATKKKYVNNQETILFLTVSNDYFFNPDNIRIPYFSTDRIKHAKKKGILKNGKRWYPNKNGKLCTDVWEFTSQRHKEKINGKTPQLLHPTPKPIELIKRIILASSNENDLILDLFSGIGTTAICCKELNRKFIGCENNKSYFNEIYKKLNYVYSESNK